MSFRETFSRVKKDVKDRFKGSKRKKDRKGPGASGGRAEMEESLSRSESPFVEGGDRDPEGSGAGTVGGPISSTDRPAQQGRSEPASTSERIEIGQEARGKGDVDQIEAGQSQQSYPHSAVEAVVESGHGGDVEQVPPDASIPGSAEPNGM